MTKYNFIMMSIIVGLLSLHLTITYFGVAPYGGRNAFLKTDNIIAFRNSGKISKTAIVSKSEFNKAIYLIGSSRVRDGLNPKKVEEITGKEAFNYGMSGLLMSEMYDVVDHLNEHKTPETFIIGLDFFAFNDAIEPSKNMTLKPSPDIKDYLTLYLSKFSIDKIIEQIEFRNQKIKCHKNGFCKDTRFSKEDVAKYIERGLTKPNDRAGHVLYEFEQYKNSMKVFHDTLASIKEKEIDVRLFISPSHHDYMEYLEGLGLLDIYQEWKKEITAIVQEHDYPLYDFEIASPATTLSYIESHQFFNDDLHYNEIFGDIILQAMFENKKQSKYFQRLN